MIANEERVTGFKIKHAVIKWPKFGEAATKDNPDGKGGFALIIEDEDFAHQLIEDGWNVNLKQGYNGGPDYYQMNIKVSYLHKPPTIRVWTQTSNKYLNEHNVGMLDGAEIIDADVSITPSFYTNKQTKRTGISAYLKCMYALIEPEDFSEEWENRFSNQFNGEEE